METEEEWVEWDGSERESEKETSQMVEELVDESMESFGNTVDSLLQESLNSFLDEGPILHIIEHQYLDLKLGDETVIAKTYTHAVHIRSQALVSQ